MFLCHCKAYVVGRGQSQTLENRDCFVALLLAMTLNDQNSTYYPVNGYLFSNLTIMFLYKARQSVPFLLSLRFFSPRISASLRDVLTNHFTSTDFLSLCWKNSPTENRSGLLTTSSVTIFRIVQNSDGNINKIMGLFSNLLDSVDTMLNMAYHLQPTIHEPRNNLARPWILGYKCVLIVSLS